ncbi:MFS transporter [Leucobacter chromiireducens]|uniref:MFS transporter n=1 Tax=Leucobacter chromiireducens TaxID=283877 RepID=UPI00192872E8
MVLLAVLALVVLSQLYGALVLGPTAAGEFGTGGGGLVQTAFGIAYAAGFIAWGPLVDRFDARRILLLGLIGLALTTAFVAFSPTMAWLIFGRIAQGLAAASFAPAAFSYFGSHLPMPSRVTAITVLTSSFLAAAVLGQVAAQAITDTLSWRWFFGISAILLAIAVGAAARVLHADQATDQPQSRPFAALATLLGNGRILVLLIATLAILGPFIALYAALGHTAQFSGNAMLTLRLSALPALVWAGFASGWLARFSASSRLIVGFTGAAVAAAALALVGGNPVGAAICLFVFAACVSILAPAMIQALTGLAPEQRGSITALYTFALFLGASLAPLPVATGAAAPTHLDPVATTALISAATLLASAALTAAASRARPA